MSNPDKEHDHDKEHDDVDGCLCDIKLDDAELASDEDLPVSQGGVDVAASESDPNAEDIDGCDLDFYENEDETTADVDLPVSIGGVA